MVLKKHKRIPIVKNGWEVSDILNLCLSFLFSFSASVQVPEGARGDVTDVVGGFCVHASSVCRCVELEPVLDTRGKMSRIKWPSPLLGHDCRAVSLYHESV